MCSSELNFNYQISGSEYVIMSSVKKMRKSVVSVYIKLNTSRKIVFNGILLINILDTTITNSGLMKSMIYMQVYVCYFKYLYLCNQK